MRFRTLVFPAVIVAVHTVAVIVFAFTEVPIAGPKADAGVIRWTPWLFIDFPVSMISLEIACVANSNATGVGIVAFFGAFQWFIWALVLQWLFAKFLVWWETIP
jgi:hypothetical protein